MRKILITLFISFLFFSTLAQKKPLRVTVVTHSVSTEMVANSLISNNGWKEDADLRSSDYILVICRSELDYPLNDSYDSFKELDEDADNQLNIAGTYCHVYLFKLQSDLTVSEYKHNSFKAED